MRKALLFSTVSLVLIACANSGTAPLSAPPVNGGPVAPGSAPLTGAVYAPEIDANGNPVEAPLVAGEDGEWGIRAGASREYGETIRRVTSMVSDSALQRRVARRGLSVMNVMWEDTGRFEGSSVGPNISDLTLQVRRRAERGFESSLLPVIRFPNFSDRTGDIPADRFFVRLGNQRASVAGASPALETLPLTTLLQNIGNYSSDARSLLGTGSLLAARDSHFLVSAQAVFLPIPKQGKAEFNPVLFNYQSARGAPAVLSILVTRQGTTMRVIENRSDESSAASGMGQELYFNNNGQRAAFSAERKSDVEAKIAAQGGPKTADDVSAMQKGADSIFLIQVPLLVAQRRRAALAPPAPMASAAGGAGFAKPAAKSAAMPAEEQRSDVEQAVIGHGPNLGKFQEGFGTKLTRDTRFPIRITVQFYKATSNGVVSDADLDAISASLGQVYEHADSVGSLVLPEDDRARPTAWSRIPNTWFRW
jgi:hypothetical protein